MGKPRLRQVKERLQVTQLAAELGLDLGLCDSELALGTALTVLTGLGSEKTVMRKGPQRNA